MLVTRCVECNHEELSVNSGCLCACHVRVESARTPAERIAELEARLAMVVEVCSTQRSALMDLLAALEFEFTAMSRAKLLPRGDELNHHFAHFLSRVKDLDITPAEATVAAFIARVEARGAARELRRLAGQYGNQFVGTRRYSTPDLLARAAELEGA